MPELNEDACNVKEMTDDEVERAVEEAVDELGEEKEVTGFAQRDS